MKKLESISVFEALNATHAAQLRGGNGYTTLEAATPTAAGSKEIKDACGKVVCISHWTSDCQDQTGIEYYGTSVTYP
jgi:hypothetical protein